MTEAEYIEVGRKFGKYAKANKPSPSQMQAYLSDHLVDDDALVAMKEVVTRADFHNLLAHTNTTNSRASLDSLLSELTDLYSPRLVACTRLILEGMLRLENTEEISDLPKQIPSAKKMSRLKPTQTSAQDASVVKPKITNIKSGYEPRTQGKLQNIDNSSPIPTNVENAARMFLLVLIVLAILINTMVPEKVKNRCSTKEDFVTQILCNAAYWIS